MKGLLSCFEELGFEEILLRRGAEVQALSREALLKAASAALAALAPTAVSLSTFSVVALSGGRLKVGSRDGDPLYEDIYHIKLLLHI